MSRRIKWIAVVICLVMLFQNTAVLHTTAAEDTIRTLRSGRVTVTGEFPKGASLSASRLPNPFKTPYSALAFYDIKAKHGKDTLHPESPVTVTITGLSIPDGKDIQVIHVLDDAEVIRKAVAAGTASVTDDPEYVRAFPNEARAAFDASGVRNVVYVEYLTSSDGTVTIVDNRTVSFETASFSVFIITDTTFEKSVAASDGNTYEITAKYDVRAEIPRDAALQVSEIAAGSEEYNYYVEQTAEKIGCTVEELTYIRLFDIKLYGTESGKYYQPNSPVTLSIRLADREEIEEPVVRVIHFGENVEQLKSTVDGNVVTFTTNGFSVYTLTPDQHRHTYRFFVPTDEEQTEFEEYHIYTDTGSTTFTQVIKDHSELVMPQLPSIENSPTSTFAGWYEGTESSGSVTLNSKPFDFENLPEITDDREIRLYARFGKYAYVIFHEEYNGNTNSWPIAATRRGEIASGSTTTTVRIDDVSVAYDDSNSHQNLQPGQTPPPPAMAFRGWTRGSSINLATHTIPENAPLEQSPITISVQTDLYPVFSHINWLTPVSGPTGSGATYFAPTFYYSDEGLENLNDYRPERRGYAFAGWYTGKDADGNGTGVQITNASGTIIATDSQLTGTGLSISDGKLMLSENVSIYARWDPAPTPYHVVIWQQKSTDEAGLSASEKSYDYYTSYERSAVTGSTVSPSDDDLNLNFTNSDFTGFVRGAYDTNVVVKSDGTTVVNVYYDRREYTLQFRIPGGSSHYEYTPTTSTSGTQYGYVDGEFVQLTSNANSSLDGVTLYNGQKYSITTNNNTSPQQYGVVNGQLVPLTYRNRAWYNGNTRYYGTRYVESGTGTYAFYNGQMVELQSLWYYNGNAYTGSRYTRVNTTNTTIKTIYALYDHDISDNFPIVGTNGVTYDQGQRWSPQNSSTYSQVLVYIQLMPAESIVFQVNTANYTTKTMRFNVEVLPGEEGFEYNNVTYKNLNTITANYNFITEAEDFIDLAGYSKNGSNPAFSGGQTNTSQREIDFYYLRNTYNIEFRDSKTQDLFNTVPLKYEYNIADALPEDPTGENGYTFSGWYADPACSKRVFFTQEDYNASTLPADRKVLYETMPDHNLQLFAGWSTNWYLIKIDPNGGEYPSNSNYSTWFWKQFGTTELVVEYENTTRDFVESLNGTWYYAVQNRAHYGLTDEWDDREDYISDRKAYYTQDISDPAIVDLGVKYKQAEGAYRYASWFKVLYDEQGNETGEELYNFSNQITGNLTLRLHWKHVGTYNIRYDPGIGELDGNDSNEVTFHLLDEADYADKSDIVVTRTAIAPEGYNFIGWTIRGDDSGTIYYPGLAMEFQSRFAVKEVVNGETHEYLILDAVYSVAKTAKIIYDANGGTIDSDTVDYGHPSDPNPPAYETDCTDTQATISHLVNNSGIVLSDGTGFSYEEVGAEIVGWNTKPDGSGEHFDLGAGSDPNNPHYVDAEEPLTLYAEWEVKVYFHKNNIESGSTLGGTWDDTVYTYDGTTYENALECYYTTVLLGKPVDLPPYTPTDPSTQNADPEDDIVFHFWTNARYVYPAQAEEAYDFSQPVNGELHLYAYWDTPITVPIHVVDSTSGLVLMDNDPEHDWLLTDAIQVISGTDTATANSSDADNFISVKPANPGEDSYLFAFACISDSEEHISEDKIITSIYYNNATRTAWVTYENGSTAQLPDDDEIYFVYFRYPRTVDIEYKVMDTSGNLSDPDRLRDARITSASIGDYYMDTDPTGITGYTNHAVEKPIYWAYNDYPQYSFAIGDKNASDIGDLHLITTASNSDSSRPALEVKNFWNGFRYITDGGTTWIPCGKDITLYVIYYKNEAKPVIINVNEKTLGLEEDLLEEFTYNVVITQTVTTYTRNDTRTGNTWTEGTPVADTSAETQVREYSFNLKDGEADSETIFYAKSAENYTSTGSNRRTATYTVTTQTITVTQTQKNGFVTTNDQSATPYVYTYTTAADSTDQEVTYTNKRTPFKIEAHVVVAQNGELVLHDADMRSSDSDDYTLILDIDGSVNLSGTNPIDPFTGDRSVYVFAGVIYGTNEEGGTIVTPAGDVTSVEYQTVPPGTYYDLFLNGDANLTLGGEVSVNNNGTSNDISDDYSELTGGYKIYYVYYELPKIYYVRETAAGTLVQYDPVQRNGAPVTLNGQTVAQGNVVPVSESGTVISQSVSGGYRVPPDLDGSGVLSSDYLKIGVGDRNVTNVSGLTATNDRKLLYIKVIDGQLKWSFDNSSWNNFTSTAAGEPTIYVIYRDDQDNRLVIVREDGAAEQDFWYTVTGPGGIEIEVCIPAGRDRVTITGVPYGNYTAVEHADWSWRYDTETSKTTTVYGPEDVIPTGALIGDSTINFSGQKDNDNWLNGIHRAENQYGNND